MDTEASTTTTTTTKKKSSCDKCSVSALVGSLASSVAKTFSMGSWRRSEDDDISPVSSPRSEASQEENKNVLKAPKINLNHSEERKEQAASGLLATLTSMLPSCPSTTTTTTTTTITKTTTLDSSQNDMDSMLEEGVFFNPKTKCLHKKQLSCPECRNIDHQIVCDYKSGDLLCSNCGMVVGDRIIDEAPETRTFADDHEKSGGGSQQRYGAAGNKHLQESGLMTGIDSNGIGAKTLQRAMMEARRDAGDQHLVEAFKEISLMAHTLGVPNKVTSRAQGLYKQMTAECKTKINRHKAKKSVVAASLYVACRQENVVRTIKEICRLTGLEKKELGKAYKQMDRILKTNLKTVTADDFMDRFCNTLGMSFKDTRAAASIAKRVVDLEHIGGECPLSIASAAIFTVTELSQDKKTQREIARVAGVSTCTVRTTFKKIQPHLLTLVPESLATREEIEELITAEVRCEK